MSAHQDLRSSQPRVLCPLRRAISHAWLLCPSSPRRVLHEGLCDVLQVARTKDWRFEAVGLIRLRLYLRTGGAGSLVQSPSLHPARQGTRRERQANSCCLGNRMGNFRASDGRKVPLMSTKSRRRCLEEVTHMPASEPPSTRFPSCVAFSISL